MVVLNIKLRQMFCSQHDKVQRQLNSCLFKFAHLKEHGASETPQPPSV